MGLKSVVSEVSPIFSSANRPSVLKGGVESWFPVKEFTLKRKKPRQLSSHRNQGNAVRVARYRQVETRWVEDVTRDQVLYKFLESPSFGDRTDGRCWWLYGIPSWQSTQILKKKSVSLSTCG